MKNIVLFANNCCLNAVDKFSMVVCDNFGLTINIQKIEVTHQPAPHALYTEPQITNYYYCLHLLFSLAYAYVYIPKP